MYFTYDTLHTYIFSTTSTKKTLPLAKSLNLRFRYFRKNTTMPEIASSTWTTVGLFGVVIVTKRKQKHKKKKKRNNLYTKITCTLRNEFGVNVVRYDYDIVCWDFFSCFLFCNFSFISKPPSRFIFPYVVCSHFLLPFNMCCCCVGKCVCVCAATVRTKEITITTHARNRCNTVIVVVAVSFTMLFLYTYIHTYIHLYFFFVFGFYWIDFVVVLYLYSFCFLEFSYYCYRIHAGYFCPCCDYYAFITTNCC